MQMEKAAQLRKLWKAKGNPPCNHPDLDKEYYLGADTGDYVCTTCGESFAPYDLDDQSRPKST